MNQTAKKVIKTNIIKTGMSLVLWFVLFLAASTLSELFLITKHIHHVSQINYPTMLILQSIACGLMIIFIKFIINRQFKSEIYLQNNWDLIHRNLVGFFVLLSYILLALINLPQAGHHILLTAITAFLIAISEEYYFRGVLIPLIGKACNYINKVWKPIVVAIIDALIFAIAHCLNLSNQDLKQTIFQIMLTFALGVILATSYITTDNLRIPIILHFLIDWCSLSITSSLTNTDTNWVSVGVFMLLAFFALLDMWEEMYNGKTENEK